MSFISNLVMLRAGGAFDDPEERHHLRRLWLTSTETPHRPPLLGLLYDMMTCELQKPRREMAQSRA
jgi:hypothetical protein